MNQFLVSVIVPAYNAQATIAKVIQSICALKFDKPYEVIVVDDGSTDTTASIIKTFDRVKYCYQINAGPASARNHGARIARGEYLAFTDSDCLVHEDWLTELLKCFDDKNIGVVCGSYGIANKESLLARCIHAEIRFRHTKLMPEFPKAFGGYNFCARKEVFSAVGGFNETYRYASGEDNELSYKILHAGYRIKFNRQALVDHYHPTDPMRYMSEQSRHGQWRVVMYAQYPSMLKGDDYTFWKDIIEPILVYLFIAMLVVTPFIGLTFVQTILNYLVFFLIGEIIMSLIMLREIVGGIYFGFVFFFRAFARTFGFSTGILQNFFKKK